MGPAKRARVDTDDRYGGYPGGHPSGGYQQRHYSGPRNDYGYHPLHGGSGHYSGNSSYGGGTGPHPPRDNPSSNLINDPNIFLSFKAFMFALPEEYDELVSVKKYSEYKMNFKKDQAKRFFDEHKDQEWFRYKYRPTECEQRERDQRAAWQRRLRAFMDLLERGWLDKVSLDTSKAADIRKFLDAFVMRLQGGSDNDLKALEETDYAKSTILPDMVQLSEEAEKLKKESEAGHSIKQEQDSEQECKMTNGEATESAPKDPSQDEDQGIDCADDKTVATDAKDALSSNETATEQAPMDATITQDAQQAQASDGETVDIKMETDVPNTTSGNKDESARKPIYVNQMTSSISLRTVHPNATREEVEQAAREMAPDHFLRVAFAEPIPPKFYRRAFITYKKMPEEELKNICWKFNNIRYNNHDTLPMVYKHPEESQRIKPVSGLFEHKSVMRADLQHVFDLIKALDQKRKIWEPEQNLSSSKKTQPDPVESDQSNSQKTAGEDSESTDAAAVASITEASPENREKKEPDQEMVDAQPTSELKNPLLENIKEYLIEETNTEQMELVGTDNREEGEAESFHTVRDEQLISVLDRLILYLRCVHSFDYYSANEYNEEDMPHPLLYMYARGPVEPSPINTNDINDLIKQHAAKIKRFTEEPCLSESELKQLGKLDVDAGIDEFIQKNTVLYEKDGNIMYICSLSKKKFKAPEFVRKHILSKYKDVLDDVRIDIEFFNNYLADPRRPNNEVIMTKYDPKNSNPPEERIGGHREPHGDHSSPQQWQQQRHYRPRGNYPSDKIIDHHHHRNR